MAAFTSPLGVFDANGTTSTSATMCEKEWACPAGHECTDTTKVKESFLQYAHC